MIELTKTLLTKALASIKAEPEKWDQQDWVVIPGKMWLDNSVEDEISETTNPSCGTTLCLAGWMSHHLEDKDAFGSYMAQGYDLGTALSEVLSSAGESETVLESLEKLFFITSPDSLEDFLKDVEAALGVSL